MDVGSIQTVPVGTVVVGGNVLRREGLARILSEADFRVIASTSCTDNHVLSTLPEQQSLLLIIDVSDDFEAALRQIESFKHRHPAGRVAVLADQHHLSEMVSAFRVGANAYLVNVSTCETFIKSIELVMLGATFLPPEILTLMSHRQGRTSRVADDADDGHADDDDEGVENGGLVEINDEANKPVSLAEGSDAPRLSARQQSILRCLVQGGSNKTIARKMAMAEATVKVHVKAIFRKIRVHNRTQAAIWAMHNDPCITPNEDASPSLQNLSVEQFTDPGIAQAPTRGRKHGSTALPTFKINGASHVAMPDTLHLVRKNH